MPHSALFQSNVPGYDLVARGKVRDIYEIDSQRLLIVTTDRLSAFDVVLPDPIPGKGEVLTQLSNFWFDMVVDIVPNHLTNESIESLNLDATLLETIARQCIIVKRLHPLPIEAVVRGYLIGSGWRDYLQSGNVCGINLPDDLRQGAKLQTPIFTPASKATAGEHDENISMSQTEDLVGEELASRVREISLEIYQRAAEYAFKRGIIIADCKFEFGLDDEGDLYIIDEILTPDSSRFWSAANYRVGISPPSFDKQFVRDYLETLDWDKTNPGPALPAAILKQTGDKYRDALRILTK